MTGDEDEIEEVRRIVEHRRCDEEWGWMGGIIPRTGAVLHSLGRGTLPLFNWIWVSCCLSAYELLSVPSQLSKPS